MREAYDFEIAKYYGLWFMDCQDTFIASDILIRRLVTFSTEKDICLRFNTMLDTIIHNGLWCLTQLACPTIRIMKRVINNPNEVAAEAVEGFALAYAPYVRQIEGLLAVVRRDTQMGDEVAIVTGGG